MTKNSFFIFVVVLVVGFAIWFSRFGKELKQTQDLVVDQQERTQRILRRRVAAVPENSRSATEKAALKERLQSDLQGLSTQLKNENDKLDSQRSYLENIKQQLNPKVELNYSSQIRNLSDEIQELSDMLRSYQWAEGDLNREVYQGLQEQNVTFKYSSDQMDQNILIQEQAIKETRDELAYWLLNNSYVNEKEARVQELQGLLADQLQQINDMKIQRAQLSVRSLEQIQSIQNQARGVASTISDSRADIQEQMSSLRGEIQRACSDCKTNLGPVSFL